MDRQTLEALVITNPVRARADAMDAWRTGDIDSRTAIEIIEAANKARQS